MTVVRYEPWALLNRLHREFDQTFETAARDASWAPAVDIHEEAQRFIVRADLPGVKPADIEVTADKGVLTLRGDRRPAESPTSGREGTREDASPEASLLSAPYGGGSRYLGAMANPGFDEVLQTEGMSC